MPGLAIDKQLKKARQQRGMTLEEAAAATGVSKPMLGQIERGQSSPTIHTLWKIATGLKVPLSGLLQEPQTEYSVVRAQEQEVLLEEGGRMRAYTIFPYDPIRNFETFYVEFDAGCMHQSDGHNDGVLETLFVLNGKLDVCVNGETIPLSEKQAIRFLANGPHAYQNPYNALCCVYHTIYYGGGRENV